MSKMQVGKRGNYYWLQTPYYSGFEVLRICPQLLQDTRLLITSVDGGKTELLPEEKARGFQIKGSAIVAPAGIQAQEIPEGGANEWYFFQSQIPAEADLIKSFASLSIFHFSSDDRITAQQEQFWSQLQRLNPVNYLCDTNILLFATLDQFLHTSMQHSLIPKT